MKIHALVAAGALLIPQAAAPAQMATFQREAVAAAHPLASQAGAEILAAGGNAVDAAVATSFALAVVRPQSCGIGGGGFMVIHLKESPDGQPVQVAIDYRESAPRAVEPDFFAQLPDDASTRGATAVGVPGTVAGLLLALEEYGTLDRARVMAPAIRLAREGFTADDHFIRAMGSLTPQFEQRQQWQDRFGFVWAFYLRLGDMSQGDVMANAPLARCLELIAAEGAAAFYQGEIAEAIVRAIERDGGPMTREDLAAYSPRTLQPLRYTFAGYDFLGMPPPSSGGVAMAQTLGILARTPFLEQAATAADPAADPRAAIERTHFLVEALKHAFADRAEWLGDDDPPVDRLLSDAYLDELASRILRGATQPPETYGSRAPGSARAIPDDGGTSHLSVVDRWGGAVACTETVNLSFGSLLGVPEFGFILNNEMDDFTTRPGEANAFGLQQSDRNLPAPGKRPLSSMSPTIALRGGEVVAVAGAAGGPRIITATLQALLGALVFQMDADGALDTPRLHHQWSPDILWLQEGWWEQAPQVVERLEALGHQIRRRQDLGEAQLIIRRDGWQAACDRSTGSEPAGR